MNQSKFIYPRFTNYFFLIIQCVVLSCSMHAVIYYGKEFDAIRLFLFIALGSSLGCTISSFILALKK